MKKIVGLAVLVEMVTLIMAPTVYASTSDSTNHQVAGPHPQLVTPVVPSPPPGFNPLTATNVELAKYGFPERPNNPFYVSGWEQAMKHFT